MALEELMTNTLTSLNTLLQEILQKDFTARGLDTITKVRFSLSVLPGRVGGCPTHPGLT